MKDELFVFENTDGVKYFVNRFMTCIEVEIPENVETLFLGIHDKMKHSCNDCLAENIAQDVRIDLTEEKNKVYPNIKKLVIGPLIDRMDRIHIQNTMFPNVREVESKSKHFSSGKRYLATRRKSNRFWDETPDTLLNTFCLQPDETLDLKYVREIACGAFEGCGTVDVQNVEGVELIQDNAFRNSAVWNQPFDKNGCVILGTMLIKIDKEREEIEIPGYVTAVARDVTFETIKKVKVHNLATLGYHRHVDELPETLVIANDCEYFEQFWADNNGFSCTKSIEVETGHPLYNSMDGILYGKLYEGKELTLLKCPVWKTGHVKIPEGVKTIGMCAFHYSHIQQVTFPDTLRVIKSYAFFDCEELEEIHFGSGLKEIGGYAGQYVFSNTKNLKHVVFPKQITEVGYKAFAYSGVETVELNEGLQSMADGAFYQCHIKEIKLPGTISSLGLRCLGDASHVILSNSCVLPFGFAYSILEDTLDGQSIESTGVAINVGKTSIYIERPTFTHRDCEDYLNDMNNGSIKAVYDYADKNEVRFAARLIQGKNYEDFLKLLRINNHSDVRLRELLAEAQNANDTVASAYIIKECSGRGHIGTGQLKI